MNIFTDHEHYVVIMISGGIGDKSLSPTIISVNLTTTGERTPQFILSTH